ncbi:MAG: S8 family serine peptidase [Ignavibacteriales bacterium]|nr:S8 family serine peptidase [Ignavibacteriales bacterium]
MRASQSSYIVITLVAVSFMATDVSAQSWLKQFSIRQANKWQAERAIAESIAVANHLPIRVEASDGSVAELQRFVHGIPQYYATDNNLDAARTVATDKVWPGGGFGYTLNGSTDTVGEWDGGAVLTTHQEFGTRVLQTQGTSNLHSTHVAGTMIAAGVNSLAKGMSFQGRLKEWDFNNDVSEMASAAAAGLRTSNHSYGLITGWRFNFFADGRWTWFGDTTISGATDYRFGFYDDEAQTWDNIARNAPYYLMVKAAGNDRGEGPGTQPATHWIYNNNNPQLSSTIRDLDGSGTGYDCLNGASTAKNVLVVGAINAIPGGYTNPSSVVMSSFSSWGPTDDGRIKPDIVADGVNVTSSSTPNNNSYATLSGTSMATPNVTGSVGLLLQHQRNLHGSTLLRASTMRGLIIHTADEAGTNPGPDYVHGWGLMNTLRAVQLMSLDNTEGVGSHMRELTLNQGDTISMTVYSNATQPFRATICWSDPAGTPPTPSLNPSTMMVVNDLDLRIIKQSDQTIYNPWVLDPASPTTAATTGDNIRDNVEQVLIQSPTLGAYTVRITHKGILTSGPQIVSLLMSGNVPSLEARVRVSPTSSTFSINPGASAAESLTIFNDGYIAMTYSSSSGTPWLQITSGSGSVPIQSSSKIYYSLNAASLSQWTTYRDTITIASNDTAHSPTKVPITLNTLGPKIALSPPSFTLEADSGQTTRDSLKIRNTGTVALHFSVSGNDSALPAWISIDKDSSTIPRHILITRRLWR